MANAPHAEPYSLPAYSPDEQLARAEAFFQEVNGRRSVRAFRNAPVPRALIEWAIRAASTAPSGAHKQPWTFAAVSNPNLKRRIREAAEKEEYTNYHGRMSDTWLNDLKAFGTDWQKPYLEIAPWLIVLFKQTKGPAGEKHYYVNESVGLAGGMLLLALHHVGLATLTHTPSPMNFLTEVLARPSHERAVLLIPVGYPAPNCQVPVLARKPLQEVSVWYT